jgi:hypothetical protein
MKYIVLWFFFNILFMTFNLKKKDNPLLLSYKNKLKCAKMGVFFHQDSCFNKWNIIAMTWLKNNKDQL